MSTINSVMNRTTLSIGEFLSVETAETQTFTLQNVNEDTQSGMFDLDADQLAVFHAAFVETAHVAFETTSPSLLDASKLMRLHNKLF